MNTKTKVVIVGGGFGGVYTARHLDRLFRDDEIEITIINKNNYFLFTPLLHEVATGGLTPDSIIEPIREIFRGEHINFVEDSVIEIDQNLKIVKTAPAVFPYDYLVISPGADTNYMGISGVQEYSFTLKNLPDAIALRNHIIKTCETAVEKHSQQLLTVAVVGAGPTGVELAAEIKEYMHQILLSYYKDSGLTEDDIKIHLITTTPDIISMFPERMRSLALHEVRKKGINVMLNTIVTKVEPHLLRFSDNTDLKTHTIIWVAGVIPTLKDIKGIATNLKGRMDINEYLQSVNDTSVFALGDAGGSHPMLAQVAVQQGKTVAGNIYALTNKKDLSKFKFLRKGLLISLGQWYALGHFGNITLRGPLMWILWRGVYLFNFISFRKKLEITAEWFINAFYPRDISQIK